MFVVTVRHQPWTIVCATIAFSIAAVLAPGGSQARAAHARGAVGPAVVVWAGGTAPGDDLHGVILRPNGTGKVLVSRGGSDRAAGRVRSLGAFRPSKRQLAAIRRAAKATLAGPAITQARGTDRLYVAAVVQSGSRKRGSAGIGAAPKTLVDLVASINAALPSAERLIGPPAASGTSQTERPSVEPCSNGQRATSYEHTISLKDAAAAGIVDLTSKSGFDGDVIAVDADWDRIPPQTPVRVRVNIEFVRGEGAPSVATIEQGIESQLSGLKGSDGTPVSVDVVARERAAGDPPTPCFHEVSVEGNVSRSYVTDLGDPASITPSAGEWGNANTAETNAHETLHLAGLDDQYEDNWSTSNGDTPLPKTVDPTDEASLEQWTKSAGLDEEGGYLLSKPRPGHEKDIMGDSNNPKAKVLQSDVDDFIQRSDILTIDGEPGTILVSKLNGTTADENEQNLIVGADFELDVTEGEHAHVDGLVAFCIDLHRHAPQAGIHYDVLGPARDQPGPAMSALDAIARQAALRQPRPLASAPGAQAAIWRVTDNEPPGTDSPDALAILAAAGVSADPTAVPYDAPHFLNPNAGSPRSGAVSTTTVLAAPALAPPARPLGVAPAAHLASLQLTRRSLARPVVLSARLTLQNGGADVALRVERRVGRRWKLDRRLPARHLTEGQTLLGLLVPGLRPGTHRLVVTGPGGVFKAAFTVRAMERRH